MRRGVSHSADPREAIREVHDAIAQPGAAMTVLFCSSRLDHEALQAEIRRAFPGDRVFACTTAGEITPEGFRNGSVTGVSIASDRMEVIPAVIDGVREFNHDAAERASRSLREGIDAARARIPGADAFALLLIDGLSMAEEQVIAHLYRALQGVPLVGGSAGDDLGFERTWVYANGEFRTDRAVVLGVVTSHPFHIFKTQHFQPGAEKMVITGAQPAKRVVHEIDGEPAAWAYADLLGLELSALEPATFSKYPVMIRIAGDSYVRSIARVNPDESLSFFCAIDEGLVLTTAKPRSILEDTEAAFAAVRARVPSLELVLGFDCILRRLELDERGIVEAAGRLMRGNKVVGFSTYGEQLNSVHINQTLTGVALGA